MVRGRIAEVFESIQGEGIYTGVKQIFVRMQGCNLKCSFCDTKIESFGEYSSSELFDKVMDFNDDFHSISFTGGEPLLQKDFLKDILQLIKTKGICVYLETNGTMPKAFSEVKDDVDIVAMDIKLPSSTNSKECWREHKEFLLLARDSQPFVKMVICESTTSEDVEIASNMISKIDSHIPIVLQPNFFDSKEALLEKINDFRELCSNYVSDARIMPQMHKMIHVR